MSNNLTSRYGTMVFSDHVMKQYLPSDTYKMLSRTIKEGKPLDLDVANTVAHARHLPNVHLRPIPNALHETRTVNSPCAPRGLRTTQAAPHDYGYPSSCIYGSHGP